MFLQNKYSKVYFSLIERAKKRLTPEEYFERHHILPISLGGLDIDDNKVCLSAKEHYVCHLLLVKMTEGKQKRSMMFAFYKMRVSNSSQKQRFLASKSYEFFKKKWSHINSGANNYFSTHIFAGANNHFYGKHHSLETKQILREKCANFAEKNGFFKKKHSEKTRSIISEKTKTRLSNKENHPYYGKKRKDLFWISDGRKNTRINLENFEKYRENGWKRGRLK